MVDLTSKMSGHCLWEFQGWEMQAYHHSCSLLPPSHARIRPLETRCFAVGPCLGAFFLEKGSSLKGKWRRWKALRYPESGWLMLYCFQRMVELMIVRLERFKESIVYSTTVDSSSFKLSRFGIFQIDRLGIEPAGSKAPQSRKGTWLFIWISTFNVQGEDTYSERVKSS